MGRRRTEAEPAALPALEPCPRCGLRLGRGDTPTGLALHDCREVQKLRRLADKNREETSLEVELEHYIRRRIEEDNLQPQDAARVLVALRKGRADTSGDTSPQMQAWLREA